MTDVIMFQEMMCDKKKVIDFLSSILKEWNFCDMDV
jgi:hypothetical protein